MQDLVTLVNTIIQPFIYFILIWEICHISVFSRTCYLGDMPYFSLFKSIWPWETKFHSYPIHVNWTRLIFSEISTYLSSQLLLLYGYVYVLELYHNFLLYHRIRFRMNFRSYFRNYFHKGCLQMVWERVFFKA